MRSFALERRVKLGFGMAYISCKIAFAAFLAAAALVSSFSLPRPALSAEEAAPASLASARAAFAAGDLSAAESMLVSILKANWFDSDAHSLLAQIREKSGAFELSVASSEQALLILVAREITPPGAAAGANFDSAAAAAKLLPFAEGMAYGGAAFSDNVSLLRWREAAFFLGSARPEVLKPLAEAYIEYRRYSLAENALTRAIDALTSSASHAGGEAPGEDNPLPAAPDTEQTLADLYHLRGICYYYEGDFGGSLADYTLADRHGLASVDFYGDWAFTLEALDRWQDALAMWERVSRMDVPLENQSLVDDHLKTCREKAGE